MTRSFPAAPWPTALKVVSALGVVLLLGTFYAAARAIPPSGFAHTFGTGVACVPPAILIVALLFIVRGYEVGPSRLSIQRLLWRTDLPLLDVKEVGHLPDAMKCSIRVFGNGGLFSITGVYRNKKIGRYRAFVTDPRSCVVLVQTTGALVVSPENPSTFVQAVRVFHPKAKASGEESAQ